MNKLYHPIAITVALCVSVAVLAREEQHVHPQSEPGHFHSSLNRDPNLSWTTILKSAVSQSTEAEIGVARNDQAEAHRRAASSFLTGSPALEVDHYRDDVFDDTGIEEWEVGLSVDLWRNGQRSNAQQLSRNLQDTSSAWHNYHLWQLSGQLRQLLYRLLEVEIDIEQQRSFVDATKQLVTATETMYQAGAVAKVDVMKVQNLQLRQEQILLRAEAEMVDAQRNYAVFSGLDSLPNDLLQELPKLVPESGDQEHIAALEDKLAENHPLLKYIKSLEKGRDLEIKRQTQAVKGAPSARLSVRREQAGTSLPDIDSLGLSFSIPIGGSKSARAATSDISLQKAEYASQWYRNYRQIRLDLHEVEHELSVVKSSLKLVDQQLALNQARWQLAETAFKSGETNLTETLWVLQEVIESEKQAALMHLRLQILYSDYYQTLGATP